MGRGPAGPPLDGDSGRPSALIPITLPLPASRQRQPRRDRMACRDLEVGQAESGDSPDNAPAQPARTGRRIGDARSSPAPAPWHEAERNAFHGKPCGAVWAGPRARPPASRVSSTCCAAHSARLDRLRSPRVARRSRAPPAATVPPPSRAASASACHQAAGDIAGSARPFAFGGQGRPSPPARHRLLAAGWRRPTIQPPTAGACAGLGSGRLPAFTDQPVAHNPESSAEWHGQASGRPFPGGFQAQKARPGRGDRRKSGSPSQLVALRPPCRRPRVPAAGRSANATSPSPSRAGKARVRSIQFSTPQRLA